MIKLSDRLKIISDIMKDSKTMADIGTDHGFLPIYLIQENKCSKVIMADISILSLEKAKNNCLRYLGSEVGGYEFRAGDGLSVLKAYEVDTVVISGMGGKLIVDIMSADMKLTSSFRKFVLQPRIGQGVLRKWLLENGFLIVREDLVIEGNYIPEIITVISPEFREGHEKNNFCCDDYNSVENIHEEIMYKVPTWILYASGPVREFLERNIAKEKDIIRNVMKSKERDIKAEERICENIRYLERLLARCENER